MIETRIRSTIKQANEKMNRRESVQDEIKILEETYIMIIDNNREESLINVLETNLESLKLYEKKLKEAKQAEQNRRLARQDIIECIIKWNNLSFFKKMTNYKLNPMTFDFKQMTIEERKQLKEKLNSIPSKKKQLNRK